MGIILVAFPAAALALRFDKKIEETLAPSFIALMLAIYLPGLFFDLTPGFIIAIAISAASLIYVLYMTLIKKIDIRSRLFTWGALAFLVYTVFFAYYSFHRDFSHPDELYCWGLMCKNYYHYDNIRASLSTALSSDQPPLMPILGYFFARTWTDFSDGICQFGQNLFTISFLIPIFAYIKSRINASRFTIITGMLLSVMALSGMESYYLFLGDKVIAAGLCFFILFMWRYHETRDDFYYLAAILDLAALCLTKRMGAVFAAMLIFTVIPVFMGNRIKGLIRVCIMAFAASVVTLSWFGVSIYDVMPWAALIGGVILYYLFGWLGNVKKHRELIHIAAIVTVIGAVMGYMVILLGSDAYSYSVMARFMQDIITISTENGYICLSYGLYVIIAFGAALLIRQRRILKASGEVGDPTIEEVSLFWIAIAMVMYALLMLYFHIWQIGPMNGYLEGLIDRYMIPWEILVVYALLIVFFIKNEKNDLFYMFIVLVIILCVSDSREMYRQLFAKHRCIGYTALSDAGIELTPDDLVYFIDEDNYFTYSDREFYYRMWPAKTNFVDQIFMGNSGRVEFSADELAQMIKSDQYLEKPYDYLYLQTIDEDFADRYGVLFENPDEILPGHAYLIEINGDDVRFRLITK